MTTTELKNALSKLGYDCREYSGRGMMGRQCLGVELDDVSVGRLMLFALHLASEIGEVNARRLFYGARTDQMGVDYILYFPAVQWEDA